MLCKALRTVPGTWQPLGVGLPPPLSPSSSPSSTPPPSSSLTLSDHLCARNPAHASMSLAPPSNIFSVRSIQYLFMALTSPGHYVIDLFVDVCFLCPLLPRM